MPNISIDQLLIFDDLDGSQIFPHVHPVNNITYHAHVSAIFYDNAVTENVIKDGAVTTDKIADNAVDNDKILNTADFTFSNTTVNRLIVSDSVTNNQIRINQLDYTFPAIREANKFLKHTTSGNLEWATASEVGGGGGNISLVFNETLPVGAITQWGSTDTPAGWLICNGAGFDGTQYPDLSAIVGDTYKVHDGNTYYLPDYRGRVPVGVGSTNDANNLLSSFTIGLTGGEFMHQLTTGELPSHSHTLTQLDVNTNIFGRNGFFDRAQGGANSGYTTDSTGSNQFHNNLQPFLVSNYIIKAKKDTLVNFTPTLGRGLSAKDADGTVNTSSLNLSSSEIGLLVDDDDFEFDGDKRLHIRKSFRPKFVPVLNYNSTVNDNGPSDLGVLNAFRGVQYQGKNAMKLTASSDPEGRTGGIESVYNLSLFNSGINEGELGYIKPGSIGGVYFNVFGMKTRANDDIRFSYIYPDDTTITDVLAINVDGQAFVGISNSTANTIMLPVNEGQTQIRTFVGSFDTYIGAATNLINNDLNLTYHIIGVQVFE